MAKVKRSGSDSILLLGIANSLDDPIKSWGSPADTKGKFFPVRFPLATLGLGEQSEVTESGTIIGGRRAVPSQRGQLWASGDYSFEVLPGTIPYIIKMVTNPAENPTGADYTNYTSKSREILAASPTGTVTGDNTPTVTQLDVVASDPNMRGPTAQIEIGGTATGTMIVTGKRRIGKPQEEEFDFVETVNVTASNRRTKNYFSSIKTVNVTNGLAGVALNAYNNTLRYTYAFNPAGTQAPITAQKTDGGVPEYIRGLQIDSFTLSIAEIVTAVLTMTGIESTLYSRVPKTGSAIETGQLTLVDSADQDAFNTAYPDPAINFFPRWGGELRYAGDQVPFTGLDLEINNNPDTGDSEITGSRFRTPPVYGARNSTISPVILFSSDDTTYRAQDNWQALFRNNVRGELTLDIFNYLANGRRARLYIQVPAAELNTSPVVEISGAAAIPVTLAFDAIGTGGQSEMNFIVDAE